MRSKVERRGLRLSSLGAAVGALVAMSLKAAGALLTLSIFTLAARAMSPDAFGELAVWFNAVNLLAVGAVFGQDTLIARSFGEYIGRGERAMAWGAFRFGCKITFASAVCAVAAVLLFAPMLVPEAAQGALFCAVFFLFTQTLLHYLAHATRAIVDFAISETARELIWRVVLLGAVIASHMEGNLTPARFFLAAGLGQAISIVLAIVFLYRAFANCAPTVADQSDKKLWSARGLAMWQSAFVEAIGLYLDVMLIGAVASPEAAGEYFAAGRISGVFLMVMTGLNTYSLSHSAHLYFSGQSEKLRAIMRTLALVSATLLTPLLVVIFAFGPEILSIFGARFVRVYPTLLVLATACFVMSTCGSASIILLSTGHEALYSRIVTLAALLRVALSAFLAARFGAFGAACAWAAVNGPLFIALAIICRRVTGVDPSLPHALFELRAKHAAAGVSGLASRPHRRRSF